MDQVPIENAIKGAAQDYACLYWKAFLHVRMRKAGNPDAHSYPLSSGDQGNSVIRILPRPIRHGEET